MKKLICILLCLLLLAGCGAKPGEAAPSGSKATVPSATAEPTGPREGLVGDAAVSFARWTDQGIPASGSIYLTQDVVLSQPITVSGELKLHLNGHTVTADENSLPGNLFIIPAGSTMVVYDEPLPDKVDPTLRKDGEAFPTGTIASPRSFTGKPVVTSIFRVEGELILAGGHVDAAKIDLENKANGLAVNLLPGGKLTQLGGVISGGNSWFFEEVNDEPADAAAPAEQPQESAERFGRGGAIYIGIGATCELKGGWVLGGAAAEGGAIYVDGDETSGGKLVLSGATVSRGQAIVNGGAIYVAGTMEMSDGTVELGESYGQGANIYLTGTLTGTGGTVSMGLSDAGGIGYKRGGNIAVNSPWAVVDLKNVEILDGECCGSEDHGGNIAVFGQGAREFRLEGCTLSGGWGHRGGNLYVGHLAEDLPAENLDYYLKDCVLMGGICNYRGANICVDTKNKEKPIIMTLENCDLTVDESVTRDNLSLGAGGYDTAHCHVTMTGGSLTLGALTIYGDSTLIMKGVQWSGETHGGGGELIREP